jgi:hypothetical protein
MAKGLDVLRTSLPTIVKNDLKLKSYKKTKSVKSPNMPYQSRETTLVRALRFPSRNYFCFKRPRTKRKTGFILSCLVIFHKKIRCELVPNCTKSHGLEHYFEKLSWITLPGDTYWAKLTTRNRIKKTFDQDLGLNATKTGTFRVHVVQKELLSRNEVKDLN